MGYSRTFNYLISSRYLFWNYIKLKFYYILLSCYCCIKYILRYKLTFYLLIVYIKFNSFILSINLKSIFFTYRINFTTLILSFILNFNLFICNFIIILFNLDIKCLKFKNILYKTINFNWVLLKFKLIL